MKQTWSLLELYRSFEDECFVLDIARLNDEVEKFILFCDAAFLDCEAAKDKLEAYIKYETELGTLASKLLDYCELTLSVDADNREAIKFIEIIEQKLTETSGPETHFFHFLKQMEADELQTVVNSSQILKEHEFYIMRAKEKSAFCLSEAEESIIAKMQITGSMSWIKFQENIMSNLEVDVCVNGQNKRLPFTAVRNLAYSENEQNRKAAYYAELNACEMAAKSCAGALNAIKGEVITVCGIRGYKSPLEKTLKDSRIDKETLDSLILTMEENAGMFTRYFNKKAQLLNKGVLPFYDLFAPVGKSGKTFSFDEAADFVVKQFSCFSEELANYARKAVDSRWIDVYPKKGKRSGAFCQNLHYLKESRFLLNFNGSFSDVLTLAHELGHGYHGYCLYNESFLNSDYPMTIAETASTFCETIVINAALKEARGDEALLILENDISSSAQVIVDILSRYIFESELFSARAEGSRTEKELCEIMKKAQIKAYKEGLDGSALHPYMWVVKPHYYSAQTSFYNFPYAFGLLFSKGLYGKFLEEGANFANIYKNMLACSGKMSIRDVAAIAGVDLSNEKFWQSSFKIIEKEINTFVNSF